MLVSNVSGSYLQSAYCRTIYLLKFNLFLLKLKVYYAQCVTADIDICDMDKSLKWQYLQVRIDIYEGESRKATDNKLLDTFTLSGIPPLPAGQPRILVRFNVGFDGTLSASAHDQTPGQNFQTELYSRKLKNWHLLLHIHSSLSYLVPYLKAHCQNTGLSECCLTCLFGNCKWAFCKLWYVYYVLLGLQKSKHWRFTHQ